MDEIAYAKINLALHVRAREPDGYHRIETLFAFCEDGDLLSVEPAKALTLTITGPFARDLAEEGDNLVLRAARALAVQGKVTKGASLTLDKRLPVASGIGGGSADAAAALRLLSRFWDLEIGQPALHRIARRMGADVPACLASVAARGEGKGDELAPIADPDLAGRPLLLVNPRRPVATGPVFAAWDGVDRGPLGDWRDGRNDLQAPALGLEPMIGEVLAALSDAGAPIARMSGSGGTCFALCGSEAERDRIAEAIARDHEDWWMLATRLRPDGTPP